MHYDNISCIMDTNLYIVSDAEHNTLFRNSLQ